jgi:hypothetical protein
MCLGDREGKHGTWEARSRERQLGAFVAASAMLRSPGRLFYAALNRLLAENSFDAW